MSVKLSVVFLLSSLVTALSQHDMVFVKDVEEEQKNEVEDEAKVELSEDYSGVPFIPTSEWQEILPGQHIPQVADGVAQHGIWAVHQTVSILLNFHTRRNFASLPCIQSQE